MAKIMLVEDDNNLREIYEARLMAEGYDIVTARDGEEALAIAVKERPDLIISDVMMPKISGFDMLDILRSTPETKSTKVIMMTALSQAEDKARADKLGADRYLVKSQVTLEDVAKVAREVLEGDDAQVDDTTSSEASTSPAPAASTAPAMDTQAATPPAQPAAEPQPSSTVAAQPTPLPQAAVVAPNTPVTPAQAATPATAVQPAAPLATDTTATVPSEPVAMQQVVTPTSTPAATAAPLPLPSAAAMGITDLNSPVPIVPAASTDPVMSDNTTTVEAPAPAIVEDTDITAHAAKAWAIEEAPAVPASSADLATAASDQTATATVKVDEQASTSLADEEAAIAKQIESFMGKTNTGTDQTTDAVPDAVPAAAPTPSAPLQPVATEPPAPQPIADAPAPQVPVSAPAAAPDQPAASLGGQKVIAPLNDLTKSGVPDLEKLVAAEEARDPKTGNVFTPTDPSGVDPNSLAL